MSALKTIPPDHMSPFDESRILLSMTELHRNAPYGSISILYGEGRQFGKNKSKDFGPAGIVYKPDPYSAIPMIVSCPHAGIWTPKGFEDTLNDNIDLRGVLTRGDIFTDWMVANATKVGATQIVSLVAPSYLNDGRSEKSINPTDVRGGLKTLKHDPNDIYTKDGQGQGLVAVKTLYDDAPIYKDEHIPDQAEISHRIKTYYDPFHTALKDAVEQNLKKHKYSLLFDIHSCPSVGPPTDPDAGQERPDIIFSNNDGASCSPELMKTVVDLAEKFGYSVRVNDPYKGGFNTQKFAAAPSAAYQEHDFGERGSESLQIEYNRKSMGLDENALIITGLQKFSNMQRFTNDLLEKMAGYTQMKMVA